MTPEKSVLLMVDDDSIDAFTTKKAFDHCERDLEFRHLQSGEQLFEYLSQIGDESSNPPAQWPKVVLLDINMPKMGGYEVLERIRKEPKTRSLPVVMLTTSEEADHIYESYDRGANSHIVKPRSLTEMTEFANHFSAYWFELARLPEH